MLNQCDEVDLVFHALGDPYLGPTAAQFKKNSHEFDSALLSGAEASPNDLRPAYCYLVLDERGCPATAITIGYVDGRVLGTIEPHGFSTHYWVEWGRVSPHEEVFTSVTELKETEGRQGVAVELSNVTGCHETYYYRVGAENEANDGEPSYGESQTFVSSCPS